MAKTLPIRPRKTRFKKENRFKRNHKQPLPAMHENPRYTGACTSTPSCGGCK